MMVRDGPEMPAEPRMCDKDLVKIRIRCNGRRKSRVKTKIKHRIKIGSAMRRPV